MADDKRKKVYVGFAMTDNLAPQAECSIGIAYADLKPEDVTALETILDYPDVSKPLAELVGAFSKRALELGKSAASVPSKGK